MGNGHQPEAELTRSVSVRRAPVCAATAGYHPGREARPKLAKSALGDTDGLPFSSDNPEPIRVVRSEEVLERNQYREGTDPACYLPRMALDHHTAYTRLSGCRGSPTPAQPSAKREQMDVTKYWAFKNGFLNACRHRLKQPNASGGT